MPIDPMMVLTALSGILSATGVGGSKGEHGSTYSRGARSAIDDILEQIKGMKGGAIDITQNPAFQQGQDYLMSMFNDPEFFSKFEAPLQRQFEEQTIPELANRFGSMGSGGSTGSTAFRNQLAREGSNLSTNIAALRGGMQQQGVNQLLGYAQQPFTNLMSLYGIGTQPTQNVYQPPSNPWAQIFAPLASGYAQGYANQAGQRFAGQSPATY